MSLKERIRSQAHSSGFELVGFATLGEVETAPYFQEWIAAGYAGEMSYLERGAEKRKDTRKPFEGVSTAVVVGMNYGGFQPHGPVSKYARGQDYHDIMLKRLNELHVWINSETERTIHGKAYVDTGPILERDLARRAGLGWFGKNSLLINPKAGSFFFIGSLLLDLEIEPDPKFDTSHCGSCTRCLDACPTDALVDPHVLDATRCISYLTIELKGSIPEPMRPLIGELLYGCDICQDVCPWNARFGKDVTIAELAPDPLNVAPDPTDYLALTQEEFSTLMKGSPIKRTKRRGLARNSAVAIGNRKSPEDVPALIEALNDSEPLVREHVIWALKQIGTEEALEAIKEYDATRAET